MTGDNFMRGLREVLRDRRGATAVEYGLILSLIFLAMVVAIQGVATQTSSMWNNVSDAVTKN
jgi:pilus assembly protein Flp/PilA